MWCLRILHKVWATFQLFRDTQTYTHTYNISSTTAGVPTPLQPDWLYAYAAGSFTTACMALLRASYSLLHSSLLYALHTPLPSCDCELLYALKHDRRALGRILGHLEKYMYEHVRYSCLYTWSIRAISRLPDFTVVVESHIVRSYNFCHHA